MAVLLDLLKHSNMQAIDVFEQMRLGQGQRWSDILNPLGEEIRRLDFAAAAALCEAYASEVT